MPVSVRPFVCLSIRRIARKVSSDLHVIFHDGILLWEEPGNFEIDPTQKKASSRHFGCLILHDVSSDG